MNGIFRIAGVFPMVMAGVYRLLTYKPRSMGRWESVMVTWLGVTFGYLVFAHTGTTASCVCWGLLVAAADIQTTIQYCSTRPRREEGRNHSWAGRYEILFPFLFLACMSRGVGDGVMPFLLVGYVCSAVHNGIGRLSRYYDAWTPAQTDRLLAPLEAFGEWLISTGHAIGRLIIRGAKAVWRASIIVGRFAIKHLLSPRPVANARGGGPYDHYYPYPPRTTFMGRVRSTIFAHLIISTVSGVLGINILVAFFGICLALPLWLMGAKVELPTIVKRPMQQAIERAKEGLSDLKEDASDRVGEKVKRIKNRFRREPDEEGDDSSTEEMRGDERAAHEVPNIDEQAERIKDSIGRRTRSAAWKYMTR